MPVTMSGMQSGIDTDGIIAKLMDVEAKPIRQLEQDIAKSKKRKEALKALQNQLDELNKKASDLYGFRASYEDKTAVSSNPSVVDGTASKEANPGINKIQVLELASNHKISSDKFSDSDPLPEGKITIGVNEETHSIKFKGGKLSALKERIAEEAAGSISASYINTTGSDHIITLESKVSGKKGEIIITGDEEFLKKAGFIKGKKEGERDENSLIFDKKFFAGYAGLKIPEGQNGTLEVSPDGKSVSLKGLLWQDYTLDKSVDLKKDTIFEFDFTYTPAAELEEMKDVPGRIEVGPIDKINIKGIELRGYNPSRVRPDDKKEKKDFDSLLGIGIVYEDGGGRAEKIYPVQIDAKGRQEIPVGKDLEGKKILKTVFYCNDGSASFASAKFTTPLEIKGQYEIKNVIAQAKNATVKVDGIEIERDKNTDLSDVIKGMNLSLKKVSDETVTIKIDQDAAKAHDKIKQFVDAYNKYIDIHKELVKAEKTDKAGSFDRRNTGLFMGDMTILRIESSVKNTVAAAYQSRAEKPIKLFSQMGVTTGRVNANWDTIKDGKLVIDETDLNKALKENPEGVMMFFGSDTDGDNKVDAGMAYTLTAILKPYVMPGKNMIAAKIDLEDTSIKSANDRIERHEQHLKSFEKKLRTKFAAMEKSVGSTKSQQNWMNQQMKNNE